MATLLIVDDEQDICDIIEDVFLQEKGFAILKADNGPDGVKLAKEHRPDVILLDLKLQVNMDGADVLREIKQFHPKAKVVVITGYVDEKLEQEIKDLGVYAYLEKPFTPPQIIETVESALKRKWDEENG
jgi:DNA-binding NtrC family response regulator